MWLTSKAWKTAVLISATALVVSGCGRDGAPLRPSEAAIENAKANKEPLPPRPTPNKSNPEKKFILDGLLD